MAQTSSHAIIGPSTFKLKKAARSQNPSLQLRKAYERREKMYRESLVLNQDLIQSLQPDEGTMQLLIKSQQDKDKK